MAHYKIKTSCDHPQYFTGHGMSFTDYNEIVTGSGESEKEALEDAIEMLRETGSLRAERIARLVEAYELDSASEESASAEFETDFRNSLNPEDRFYKTDDGRCPECNEVSINGTRCHETGCPNTWKKPWGDAEVAEWHAGQCDNIEEYPQYYVSVLYNEPKAKIVELK